ncbi:MAG TPA: ATP-binding protein [Acidimicrobiales bacterium]|nr:ATP-binding protein [Acidimicrobiales bacterium]
MVRLQSRRFAADPRDIASVRAFVREAVQGVDEEMADDIELLASEVATNVVEHAHTDYQVRVRQEEGAIRVEVADGSSVIPAVRSLALNADRGRGLMLLEHMADSWGAQEAPDGKIVWFEMARPDSPLAPD